MNQNMGLLARKLGGTQVFTGDGLLERVTALEVGPCWVIQRRTEERDGYWALVLGFGDRKQKGISKPELGPYVKDGSPLKDKGVTPKRELREIRLPRDVVESYDVGQSILVSDVFQAGQFVDVTGTTKGKGFAGVFKRWGFRGASRTHGSHEYFRHGGSVGQNMTPGRTFKGLKMPGHHGNRRKTVQSLKVVDVIADRNVLLVRGAVPGARSGIVMVRHAAKKPPAGS
jgi:large subunit ribosomal protein L3